MESSQVLDYFVGTQLANYGAQMQLNLQKGRGLENRLFRNPGNVKIGFTHTPLSSLQYWQADELVFSSSARCLGEGADVGWLW